MLTPATLRAVGLTFACDGSNDLFKLVDGVKLYDVQRFDTAADAIDRAPDGSGVLILADGYPERATAIADKSYARATAKKLRLYVEFPDNLPAGMQRGEARVAQWERGVVASDFFGGGLPKLRIVAPHACWFTPISGAGATGATTHLAIARVAGFDAAVYGIPKDAAPLLLEMKDDAWLIAATKLSGFVTARYAPADDWRTIWRGILGHLAPGTPPPTLDFTPTVRPAYAKDVKLPAAAERDALARAARYYHRARLLVPAERKDRIRELLAAGRENDATPPATMPAGDGSLGMLEGYGSHILPSGEQLQRTPIRADCNAETAMVLALDAMTAPDRTKSRTVATNLLDYVFSPEMQSLGRLDPKHPAFGLVAWGAISPAWQVASYGDDESRVILATILASAALQSDRWDAPVVRALLANLRTTGPQGFRGDRIDVPQLEQLGWKHFHDAPRTNNSPHFESYLWAAWLWAHARTGEREFLERASSGIVIMMDLYAKKQWRWMDNIERSRMVLCLGWLIRVQDTPQHRAWLDAVATDLLEAQQPCGAIQERLRDAGGGGHFQVPGSNEAYGTTETPLLQNVGDKVSDQLYTTGFALLALREAAAATGDVRLAAAEDRLADYLCRIQVRSDQLDWLDGAWFRAFDYGRWDYWASSADVGWGAWSVEAGWGQAWIAATLALRERKTTFWEMSAASRVKEQLPKVKAEMAQNTGGPWKR